MLFRMKVLSRIYSIIVERFFGDLSGACFHWLDYKSLTKTISSRRQLDPVSASLSANPKYSELDMFRKSGWIVR